MHAKLWVITISKPKYWGDSVACSHISFALAPCGTGVTGVSAPYPESLVISDIAVAVVNCCDRLIMTTVSPPNLQAEPHPRPVSQIHRIPSSGRGISYIWVFRKYAESRVPSA